MMLNAGRYAYRLLTRPDLVYSRRRRIRMRKKCYAAFAKGETRVTRSFGDVIVSYEAISPKNYWHLTTGNQEEDRFIDALFSTHVREGMVVLDIGAHTGMYAVPMAKIVGPAGKVYALEPEQAGYDAIQHNREINELENLVAIQAVVSDESGKAKFYVRPDKDTHSLFEHTLAPSPLGVQHTVEVAMHTVDEMIAGGLIEVPDFVKIDTEGAELKVLTGMRESAAQIWCVLVEIHEGALGLQGIDNPKKAVEAQLERLGFTQLSYLDDIHLLATRFDHTSTEIEQKRDHEG